MANTTLRGTLTASLAWTFTNLPDLNVPTRTAIDTANESNKIDFSDGIGNNQADEMWYDRRLVTASTPTDDIDLYGTESNVYGRTLNFTTIKTLVIFNLGQRDGSGGYTLAHGEEILVGGAGAVGNAWAGFLNGDQDAKVVVGPGDTFVWSNRLEGSAVTSGTADVLRVVNNGALDIDYDIFVIGTK
jgi:hypothetical protein